MSENEEVIAFLAVEMLQILLMPCHRQTLFQSTKFCVETVMLRFNPTCNVSSTGLWMVVNCWKMTHMYAVLIIGW
jgi:hypothetical protein